MDNTTGSASTTETRVAGLRVYLVDDEPLARSRMRHLLTQAGVPVEVVAEFGDAVAAYRALVASAGKGDAPHALFLDIAMPGPDGLALAKQIKSMPQPPMVVFTTAHPEHALTAFEVEAIDYLTKPVRLERLNATLTRLSSRLKTLPTKETPSKDFVVVQDRGALLRVPLKDILYFKADQKHVLARTAHQSWVIDESLSDLEQRWADHFIRIHRNALVANGAMTRLERREDAVTGQETWSVCIGALDEWLAVSRRQIGLVKETMAGSM